MLGDAELLGRIESGESDRVKFTASSTDLDKFRQAICAFANDLPGNGEPGLLFIGLEDDGRCAGLTIDDALLRTLGGLRTDGKILPFPFMEVARKRLADCSVAVVQVEPSDNPPIKVDGRCWIRTGPRRSQATAEEERRLTEKRRWGNAPYDMQGVPGATVEADLDMRALDTRGERHVEERSYPYEALRELLRNAAIHRNYEHSYTPVRISWLADRVEILSPGSAFGEVGRYNFGRGATSYRNPTIAEAMKNLGFMQRFGIGIETARRTLAANDNPPPEFDVQDAFVLVTVRARP